MKPTDKMVGNPADHFEQCPNDYTLEEKIRCALEHALADVPEWPDPRNGLVPDRALLEMQARAIAAEEKFDKVRKWVAQRSSGWEAPFAAEVQAILGEEAPWASGSGTPVDGVQRRCSDSDSTTRCGSRTGILPT